MTNLSPQLHLKRKDANMNYCYNCKHHTKISEEKIYCNLKCQFKWQDDECELHDLENEQNKTEENN